MKHFSKALQAMKKGDVLAASSIALSWLSLTDKQKLAYLRALEHVENKRGMKK